MKLIFFLIAFCLISIRFYFHSTGRDRAKSGFSESNIVIKSNNFYEQINYSGKFQLSDDETSFKSISPGGYYKFRLNDIKVKAESNLRGEIEYRIYDGKTDLPLNAEGKILVAQAIKEMIYWGFDADARMERVYQRGGRGALMRETDSVKPDNIKVIYLNRLFAIDSLSPEEMTFVIRKIGSLSSDTDKSRFLNKISSAQFKNPSIDTIYFEIIKGMGSDMEKASSLYHLIDQDSLSEENITHILDISKSFDSDMDKANLYEKMIDQGMITGSHFDSTLILVSKMGSEMDKINIYRKMLGIKPITENQWISLMNNVSSLGSDMDKSDFLIEIAPVMPKTAATKAAFLRSAKMIGNDNDYGRVMRALE